MHLGYRDGFHSSNNHISKAETKRMEGYQQAFFFHFFASNYLLNMTAVKYFLGYCNYNWASWLVFASRMTREMRICGKSIGEGSWEWIAGGKLMASVIIPPLLFSIHTHFFMKDPPLPQERPPQRLIQLLFIAYGSFPKIYWWYA